MDLQQFRDFNASLFASDTGPPTDYTAVGNADVAAIDAQELTDALVLFKANRSSGLSPLPLQLLKHLGAGGVDAMCSFLNSSAIGQLAPQSWRDTKIVPLYKGKGDKADMNNYRSIAITPPFTKLFMSVMNQRLTKHAEKFKLHAPT